MKKENIYNARRMPETFSNFPIFSHSLFHHRSHRELKICSTKKFPHFEAHFHTQKSENFNQNLTFEEFIDLRAPSHRLLASIKLIGVN
jgi:hypothetical protein